MSRDPERLDLEELPAAKAVLCEAFATHPMLPPGTPKETTARLMALMVDTFGKHESAMMYCIREEGDPACVALTLANGAEPKRLALVWFLVRLSFILGWRQIREFARVMSKQPKYDEPLLELLLLGTLPSHHGKGMGRTMLRHIFARAEELGYKGVTLEVAKDTPAHKLYLKEGFENVTEASLRELTLCYMRRPGGK